jgi:hypothetical protein
MSTVIPLPDGAPATEKVGPELTFFFICGQLFC